ncbi:hypothetical protein L0Y65_07100 [Candidatus Micrarchaeota archaeon]|nr:hypothetical protein [Candidatus Micrarchaeota archaeon]
MISIETFQKLAEGDKAALAELKRMVANKSVSQPEIEGAWKALIEAIMENKGDHGGLVDTGIRLCDTSQNPESRDMYEKLFMLAAYPVTPSAYIAIIGIGAAVVKIGKNEIESKAFDKPWFVETAKRCLIRAIHETESAIHSGRTCGMTSEALEQNVIFMIEALRLIDSPEVKGELVSIIRNGFGDQVKCVAGESIGPIRVKDELEGAKADREFLLETVYPDTTAPQCMYIECVFSAVETVYSPKAAEADMLIAVRQLASYGATPGPMGEILDAHSIRLITRNVENALLHALTHGSAKAREDAAAGLQKMGSDRIEEILERIVVRLGEGSATGALASEALSCIRGGKVELLDVTFPPPRYSKPPPPVQKPKSSPTTNINQA